MVSVIFASGGSNVGAKLPPAKWIMPPIKRLQRGSLKFQSNNFNEPLHLSSQMAKRSLPPKPCIGRWDIDPRGNGWCGATFTFLVSLLSPRPLTNSSRAAAVSDRPLLGCCGAKTCDRRLIFGRAAGFSGCLDSSIWSHSCRFGCKWTDLLGVTECRRLVSSSLQCGSSLDRTPIFSCQHFAGSTRATPFSIFFAVAAL